MNMIKMELIDFGKNVTEWLHIVKMWRREKLIVLLLLSVLQFWIFSLRNILKNALYILKYFFHVLSDIICNKNN